MASRKRSLEDATGVVSLYEPPGYQLMVDDSGRAQYAQEAPQDPLRATMVSKQKSPGKDPMAPAAPPPKPLSELAKQAMSTGKRSAPAVKSLSDQANEMIAQIKAENEWRAKQAPAVQPTIDRDAQNEEDMYRQHLANGGIPRTRFE